MIEAGGDVANAVIAPPTPARVPAHYGTIVVVGGGCYGSYYVRQLARAFRADAVTWNRILVVDHNPACAITASGLLDASLPGADTLELVIADWKTFFASYLSRWASASESSSSDTIVPSPLMPHLMYEWLRDRAAERWSERVVETRPLEAEPAVPWQRSSPDGTHYVSFAEWMCPINCIEPERCPHTRGPRNWTMPRALEDYVSAELERGRSITGPIVFHCTHRAYGVGMIDTADVVAADRMVSDCGERGPAEILVGTVSHCHGALNLLSIS
ncbi:MAG: hypothetical protein ABIR58_03250 [Gemmatimonadaceae bacterium]